MVSPIDCLPWHVSFCSDRRRLIRTLADLPHNGPSKRARTSCGYGAVSLFGLSARFSVPACEIDVAPRTAAVKTGRKATVRRVAVLTAARTVRGSIRLGAPLPHSGCAEVFLRCSNSWSAGYRPVALPLDSLVGSLAARLIASTADFRGFGPRPSLADQSLALRKSQNGKSNRRRRANHGRPISCGQRMAALRSNSVDFVLSRERPLSALPVRSPWLRRRSAHHPH